MSAVIELNRKPKVTDSAFDSVIIERVNNGDIKAFDLLVLKYQHKIAHVIYSYIKDHDEVLDVCQEIFIKVYQKLSLFRGDSAFYSWLYRIAINMAKNHLLAKKIRPPQQDVVLEDVQNFDESGVFIDPQQPDRLLYNEQMFTLTQQVLDDLPDELRDIIYYREIDGMEYEEIAQVIKCPLGTVRSRLFRARKLVYDAVKHLL